MEQQFAKALSAFNAGRTDEAAAVCTQLLRQAPSNPARCFNLPIAGPDFLQLRDFAAAQKQIGHSLTLRPDHREMQFASTWQSEKFEGRRLGS